MQEQTPDIQEATVPIALVNQIGLAAVAGLSRSRITQLKIAGLLPEPYALINGEQIAWTRDQAEHFADEYQHRSSRAERTL